LRRSLTCLFGRLIGLGRFVSLLTGLNRLLQILSGRPMNQKHARRTASLSLPNQASIEAHVIRRPNANAENRGLAVDSDSSSANPLFDFATRANTSAREDLLKAFARFVTFRASATNIATMAWPGTFPRSRLLLLAINTADALLFRISLVP
jgi:hypothetical protein